MKKLLPLFVCLCALPAFSQNCSPFMGISNVQFLDNLGQPLTNGALYSYQGGTSSQQATFSDSACTISNTNPVTFTTGGRAQIWLVTANVYKFVLCSSSTDGPACAAGDTLAVADQVPGGVTGGGGGGGAPFITSSANPATTGVLRCASGDQCLAFRNVANSGNLTLTKDTHDLLSWSGGSFKLPEVAPPSSVAGFDILEADNTAHRFQQCSNGSPCAQLANAGNDISTSDAVTALHFGATQETLGSAAPTTGQALLFNGTNIVGNSLEVTVNNFTGVTMNVTTSELTTNTSVWFLPGAHTLTRLGTFFHVASSGCGAGGVVAIKDVTASSNIATFTLPTNPTIGTNADSGALSVAMPAGHVYALIVSTAYSGCSVFPTGKPWAVYQ